MRTAGRPGDTGYAGYLKHLVITLTSGEQLGGEVTM
jgi:hypothetical protein